MPGDFLTSFAIRCLLVGESQLYWPGLGLSLAVTGFFLWLGIRQFRKMERSSPI
jgi:lipopolysaccharide transport system permease protein